VAKNISFPQFYATESEMEVGMCSPPHSPEEKASSPTVSVSLFTVVAKHVSDIYATRRTAVPWIKEQQQLLSRF